MARKVMYEVPGYRVPMTHKSLGNHSLTVPMTDRTLVMTVAPSLAVVCIGGKYADWTVGTPQPTFITIEWDVEQ